MKLDQFILWALILCATIGLGIVVAGLFSAGPLGYLGLIPLAIAVGIVAIVIYQRMTNKEDDHYDRNVDK